MATSVRPARSLAPVPRPAAFERRASRNPEQEIRPDDSIWSDRALPVLGSIAEFGFKTVPSHFITGPCNASSSSGPAPAGPGGLRGGAPAAAQPASATAAAPRGIHPPATAPRVRLAARALALERRGICVGARALCRARGRAPLGAAALELERQELGLDPRALGVIRGGAAGFRDIPEAERLRFKIVAGQETSEGGSTASPGFARSCSGYAGVGIDGAGGGQALWRFRGKRGSEWSVRPNWARPGCAQGRRQLPVNPPGCDRSRIGRGGRSPPTGQTQRPAKQRGRDAAECETSASRARYVTAPSGATANRGQKLKSPVVRSIGAGHMASPLLAATGYAAGPPRMAAARRRCLPDGSRQARASITILNGVSVALRTWLKPPSAIAADSFANPACAPSAAPTG
jgi:hypothetical protein